MMSKNISIHALREEGDQTRGGHPAERINFYPHPPRGGRQFAKAVSLEAIKFLSTPSARRATYLCRRSLWCRLISIHALREEGDLW